MQIFIKGRLTRTVDVEPTDTVLSLKEKINNVEGVPPRFQLLTFACKCLEDDRLLLDYGIQRESTVEWRIRAIVEQNDEVLVLGTGVLGAGLDKCGQE